MPAGSAEDFVAQGAAEGEAGRLYVGDVVADGTDLGSLRSLYADVSDCDRAPLRLGDPFAN